MAGFDTIQREYKLLRVIAHVNLDMIEAAHMRLCMAGYLDWKRGMFHGEFRTYPYALACPWGVRGTAYGDYSNIIAPLVEPFGVITLGRQPATYFFEVRNGLSV